MSLFSRLFGSKPTTPAGAAAPAPEGKVTAEIEYGGYTIRAVPFRENGQFQTAGVIEGVVDGVVKTHRFVRADRGTDLDEITELTLSKGRLIVDQQGAGLFG